MTQKNFLLGFLTGLSAGLVLLAGILAGLLAFAAKSKTVSGLQAAAGPGRAEATAAYPAVAPAPPANPKPAGWTPPSRGPQNAPVTLEEFADFHCGFCKKLDPVLRQILQKYPDKVRLVFRHFPLAVTPGSGSFLTHEAASCAADQGKFWEFHDAVFDFSGTPQEKDLYDFARANGLDRDRFETCVKGGKFREAIQADAGEGAKRGVEGTPTVFVNGRAAAGAYPQDYYAGLIESALHPEKAPPPAPAGKAAPISEAVAFDDLEGKPWMGEKNAPVTLVEFSDFHCPFCRKVAPTLDLLMKNYPGKIKRVWRHYPLEMHAGAHRTHEASACAAEQDKFWPYHDKLFQTFGAPRGDASLKALAKDAGLNPKKFAKCLESGRTRDFIDKEIARGNQAGVHGTPAVFVNGHLVSGAYPYDYFDRLVKKELEKK